MTGIDPVARVTTRPIAVAARLRGRRGRGLRRSATWTARPSSSAAATATTSQAATTQSSATHMVHCYRTPTPGRGCDTTGFCAAAVPAVGGGWFTAGDGGEARG